MMGNKDYKNCPCDHKNHLKYVRMSNLGKIRKVVAKTIFRIYFHKTKYVLGQLVQISQLFLSINEIWKNSNVHFLFK